MRTTGLALYFAALVFTATASAADWQRVELYGDYSYIQYNTSVNGLKSRAFNGGGGGLQYNFNQHLSVKGDFQGYGSTNNSVTFTPLLPTPFSTPTSVTVKSRANMFTYMAGPTLSHRSEKLTVFGEILFGGSNSTLYARLGSAVNAAGGTLPSIGSQHPFTMAVGGGIDYNINKHMALRLGEMDYLLTRYTNPLTSTNNQNNFRYSGGFVVMFGGE
jgi:opacity protein-like surface antigen